MNRNLCPHRVLSAIVAFAALGSTFCAAQTGAVSSPGPSPAAKPPIYDVVIRNGRVLDGAGNPWIHADVAISGGHFVKIGRITVPASAKSMRRATTFLPAGST